MERGGGGGGGNEVKSKRSGGRGAWVRTSRHAKEPPPPPPPLSCPLPCTVPRHCTVEMPVKLAGFALYVGTEPAPPSLPFALSVSKGKRSLPASASSSSRYIRDPPVTPSKLLLTACCILFSTHTYTTVFFGLGTGPTLLPLLST